ncbi:MAG TPA: substrate-binding domain-containing protein [Bacillota bacterium]|nr:substrate-binding domain-containing protein [Bacillota bacterium]
MCNQSNSQPTLGLIIPNFWTGTSFKLLEGVHDAAHKYMINLICFQGYYYLNSLQSPDNLGNVVYKLVNKEHIDGLIIRTGSLPRYESKRRLIKMCGQYLPLPTVNIGSAIDGLSNVLIDNYNGMYQMLTHLIKDHGYHRIALLRGPQNHQDAQIRYQTYLSVLQEYQIPFDPNLVSPPGEWELTWARQATAEVLKKANYNVDAIVAANDLIALGALEELRAQEIRVPEDIAVVGFDDVHNAMAINPPLTTVKIRMYERGWKAVELLLDHFNGKELPEQVTIASSLIIRESCGCPPAGVRAAEQSISVVYLPFTGKRLSPEGLQKRLKPVLLEAMAQTDPAKMTIWLDELLISFTKQLTDFSQKIFIPKLKEILYQFAQTEPELTLWHFAINAIHREISSLLPPDEFKQVQKLLIMSRFTIGEVAEKTAKQLLDTVEQRICKINALGNRFINTVDLDKLVDLLALELPQLGIPCCYLCLYENPQNPAENCRLILAYDEIGRDQLPENGILYPSVELIPKILSINAYAGSLILEPLYFGENQLGFVLFGLGPHEASFYELFPKQLSTALWGALIFQKEKQNERKLLKQAKALSHSNAELKRFAYMTSHDLQEPLRKITVFGERLRKTAAAHLTNAEIDYLSRMENAANRMKNLIEDILILSRINNQTKNFEDVNLAQIASEVISDLEIAIMKSNGRIELGELPVIQADPLQMRLLFQNMLSNALKFYRAGEPPLIKIYVQQSVEPEGSIIFFEDNGIGIETEYTEKIFEVFERLNGREQFEGTGIGLAICKKLVVQHGGQIHVESEIGKGSKFIVWLPAKPQPVQIEDTFMEMESL